MKFLQYAACAALMVCTVSAISCEESTTEMCQAQSVEQEQDDICNDCCSTKGKCKCNCLQQQIDALQVQINLLKARVTALE